MVPICLGCIACGDALKDDTIKSVVDMVGPILDGILMEGRRPIGTDVDLTGDGGMLLRLVSAPSVGLPVVSGMQNSITIHLRARPKGHVQRMGSLRMNNEVGTARHDDERFEYVQLQTRIVLHNIEALGAWAAYSMAT